MSESIMNAPEPIYMELMDFIARGVTAVEVASFRQLAKAQKRVAELLMRQCESN